MIRKSLAGGALYTRDSGEKMVKYCCTLLILALSLGAVSCAGDASRLAQGLSPEQSVAAPRDYFPSVAELGRVPSTSKELALDAPYAAAGISTTLGGIALSPTSLVHDATPATAFAVYLIPIVPQTVAINVRVSSDYKTPDYVGLADWQGQRWDYQQGKYFGSFTIFLDELPGQRSDWINEDGVLALALIMHGTSGQNLIQQIDIIESSEVLDLSASTSRYDCVKVSWSLPEDIDGIRIERRRAGSSDPWDVLTAEPLNYLTREYFDYSAMPPFSYEYRVTTGVGILQPTGKKWSWSEGVTAVGQRSGIVINSEAGQPTSYIPANLYNYMSFFIQPEEQPTEVEAIKSSSYPPLNHWDVLKSGDQGMGPFELSGLPGLGVPFNLHQIDQVNTPFATLGFSRAEGTFTQVVGTTSAGLVSFETPLQILGASTHFFGFVELPRSLGAVYWDNSAGKLKMLQSWEELGQEWRSEGDMVASWIDISSHRPAGRVYMESRVAEPHICFRAEDTGEIVMPVLTDGWHDEAPAGVHGLDPAIRQIMSESFIPGKGLFYIDEDHSSVHKLLRDILGVWHPELEQTLNANALGETGPVTEFEIYTRKPPSFENYLVFIQGGHVYMLFSSGSTLSTWSQPMLIDGIGTCSDLHLLLVGADADFGFKLFATYMVDDGSGNRVISFRDIAILKQESLE